MAAEGFWNNQESAQETVGRLKTAKAIVAPIAEISSTGDDLSALIEMADEDDSVEDEVRSEIQRLEQELESLELKSLLNGPYDSSGAILTIHARDGGTDANDWADMMLRMYSQWAAKNDYSVVLIDRDDNSEAGINTASIVIRGPMAYGYLKSETGLHRLVRISPFNSEGKRQTSFAAVDVTPEISDSVEIDIEKKDVREDTYKAIVQCQSQRSQHKNRAQAWKMLRAQLARVEEEKREAEEAEKYQNKARVGFGSQIRNYFQHPDQRVKDARTGFSMGDFHKVLDGEIQGFLDSLLTWRAKEGR